MVAERLKECVPYLIALVAAAVLWGLTSAITFDARPGQIGPTFWPRAAIALMALSALVEISRILLARGGERLITGVGDALQGEEHDAHPEPSMPQLLAGGVALTVAFGLLVTSLGFLLSVLLYLVAFMYLGRYRNHLVIWTSSLVGTLLIAVVFLKIVYVSLPRGVAPFDSLTQAIVDLLSLR
ncbi:MAG: tripartite tricarboxylate transporter TctB family protein [Pseudomonadota bacterium]